MEGPSNFFTNSSYNLCILRATVDTLTLTLKHVKHVSWCFILSSCLNTHYLKKIELSVKLNTMAVELYQIVYSSWSQNQARLKAQSLLKPDHYCAQQNTGALVHSTEVFWKELFSCTVLTFVVNISIINLLNYEHLEMGVFYSSWGSTGDENFQNPSVLEATAIPKVNSPRSVYTRPHFLSRSS